jgi:hypothetical protein
VLQKGPFAQLLKILFQPVFRDENLIHASVVDPPEKSILGTNLPTCALAPLGRLILPSLTAALAVGKDCGVVIPATGTRSDPNSAATTTRLTFERNPSRIFFVLKDNMLNS